MLGNSNLVSWLYLDMNSFFASVEQELNPSLRGKPVAVVPMLADTTCCIAVSYEGKAFGVKTGTKVGDAKRLCPGIQLIEGDHGNYVKYHNQIVEAVESCIPVEAVCSIDEIACRLTGSQQDVQKAQSIATNIKKTIRLKVGSSLCCSIGVAPNRYLAKIAADMNKPDGFTVIRPCDLPGILYSLKLRDLPGVGPRMEANLNRKKIFSIEKLCSLSPKEMHQAWGSITGEEMFYLLRGQDIPQKVSDQKSISQSHVLPPDLRNTQGALKTLKKLTTKAALRLRKESFFATKLSIFVKFLGQNTWKASCSFMETQDTLVFLHIISKLWEDLPYGAVYSVGVALFGIVPESQHALSLFDDPKRDNLTKALDRMNEKYGKEMVHFGATHDTTNLAPLRIAFTRIPDESET